MRTINDSWPAQPKPRVLVVTRGDYITRTVLMDLFESRRFELRVVIVNGDHRGRTGLRALRELWRPGARRYCLYEITQKSFFSAIAKVRRRSGLTVYSMARRLAIPVLKTTDANTPRVFEFARSFEPDILLSAKCPQLIGRRLRQIARAGCVNVHASLLPKYAGRAPHFWAMVNGEALTGSTAHYMNGRFDAGEILAQAPVEIDANDSAFSLLRKLASAGGHVAMQGVERALSGAAGASQESGRFYCSQPTREACRRFRKTGRRLFRFRELLSAANEDALP